MVKDRLQTALTLHRRRDPVRAVGKDLPIAIAQSHVGGDPTGILRSHRMRAIGIRQHQKRTFVAPQFVGSGRQQARRLHNRGLAGCMCRRVAQIHTDKRSGQREAASAELLRQPVRLRGHEAPIAQFRPGIARLDQFVQHPGIGQAGFLSPLKLQRAPRTRSITDRNRHRPLLVNQSCDMCGPPLPMGRTSARTGGSTPPASVRPPPSSACKTRCRGVPARAGRQRSSRSNR